MRRSVGSTKQEGEVAKGRILVSDRGGKGGGTTEKIEEVIGKSAELREGLEGLL